MKIITKDNFDRDLFVEVIIAEKVTEHHGKEIVQLLNDKHWTETSDHYYALVEDDYKPYNGYDNL